MGQYYFIFNQALCIKCNSCVIGCKSKNKSIDVKLRKLLPEPLSISCNHCKNPTCKEVCPVGAINKNQDNGIVTIDPESCIGCKRCSQICLYQAPSFSKVKEKAYKCDLCQNKLKVGKSPLCVERCMTGALKIKKEYELTEGEIGILRSKQLPYVKITNPAYILKSAK
ncbi:4Fe-4S dicluster domain-containing protein [Natroniella sulfidigena]|uniref:4Fe-4S dicluster domain-containing protein n=1 Tax=Natroniella sulfidigena TaxID=723921 RepID=UPI002009EADF|nr:4Fe-4S dicluster domain-containing protein [Natroniella sulfidigena]MCK8818225.1 4Fe-4S dicluster domain-containing protein [Natroniella sulfidigena]